LEKGRWYLSQVPRQGFCITRGERRGVPLIKQREFKNNYKFCKGKKKKRGKRNHTASEGHRSVYGFSAFLAVGKKGKES